LNKYRRRITATILRGDVPTMVHPVVMVSPWQKIYGRRPIICFSCVWSSNNLMNLELVGLSIDYFVLKAMIVWVCPSSQLGAKSCTGIIP
jgi:hypothetical protein